MDVDRQSDPQSVHRVSTGWRWFSALSVPPLIALMAWAGTEAIRNAQSNDTQAQVWAAAFALVVFGGLSLVFVAALIWAFRARIVIQGERMTVRGAFLTVNVTAGQMDGFRMVDGTVYLYMKNRHWALKIAYFERLSLIMQWIRQRTRDLVQEVLADENAAISGDMTLGLTETDKTNRLEFLNKGVRAANLLIYVAAAICAVNFLFIEHPETELICVVTLIAVPALLNVAALLNRGHIHVDYDEGTRYPQIFSSVVASGWVLALMSLMDKGALLGNRFLEILVFAAVANGLLWSVIDSDRLRVMRERGTAVLIATVIGLFVMPAFWVGGSLYQLNKHLDDSATVWYSSSIVDKKTSSGKTVSYSVELSPWDEQIDGPVEFTLRRAEFNALEKGMGVRVGTRQGGFGIPWVAEVVPDSSAAVD